jgi:fumarate hydratase subunit alpha
MKEIYFEDITSALEKLAIEANLYLPDDMVLAQKTAKTTETDSLPISIFSVMEENLNAAKELKIPICQDTGMAVVFIEMGRDVHLNCNLTDAVNEGIRRGYKNGFLRYSIVRDPLLRENTGDNTPAIIYTEITDGDGFKITLSPKGFGSENMSRQKMFLPTATKEDILGFVVETVKTAGSNPCPPIVIGIGIGGDFEYSAYLSKKALIRDLSLENQNSFYKNFEKEILEAVNKLQIGPQGLGGNTTALAVNIEVFPTHIAGLPVAVNIGCHVNRHKSITL